MSISYLKSLLFRNSPTDAPSEPWLVPEKDTTEVLTLPDGRKLGYSQYGLSTGKPIFYCHGLPGSRVEAGHLHEAALETGARIIATDRPGMGLSTFQTGRTLLDHPKDLEHLASHLKINEYGVMGVSGGGPYALACARAMPRDKLKAVAIVCGIGPPDIGMSGAGWFHWLGFTYGWRYGPRVAGWYFHREGQYNLPDEQRLELRLQEAEKKKATFPRQELGLWSDREIVTRMVMTGRQYYRQGIDGHDTFVPPNHGVQIAKRLGDHAHLRLEDDTHASIFFRWRKEVLADLVKHI
ncbi:hypothetical protein CGMCC3_g17262 [Colletotrichum fructicola]|nr:uncharacterized protein CGMCC3_g17262 [Colletotrichum fructicola]KAE9566593.1 hypothetical protein CGMCC3_g17262 [Colletotrichum fructicola]